MDAEVADRAVQDMLVMGGRGEGVDGGVDGEVGQGVEHGEGVVVSTGER